MEIMEYYGNIRNKYVVFFMEIYGLKYEDFYGK